MNEWDIHTIFSSGYIIPYRLAGTSWFVYAITIGNGEGFLSGFVEVVSFKR